MDVNRKIIHVDMDCFFAAVEQRDNPALRGLPVAVGHDEPRGVVSTASYEARRFGVHSAQAMVTAKRLCPQLVIVPPRFGQYKAVSAQVHEIFRRYTDVIEPVSIDEAFLDVTENKRGIRLAQDVAKEIKQAIRDELQLTASAGVSYCKLLAKIASDFRKPDGLCVVHPERAQGFIDRLPVEKFWGVGQKTAATMHRMGIYYGRQLRDYSLQGLTRAFGTRGQSFYDAARGIDESPVVTEWERKSVSCERTFDKDIHKRTAVIVELYHAVLELERRLAKSGFEGRTLTLKVKFADFSQITRSITQERVLRHKDDILPLARQLMARVDYSAARPIRLIGLGVQAAAHEAWGQAEWQEGELDF